MEVPPLPEMPHDSAATSDKVAGPELVVACGYQVLLELNLHNGQKGSKNDGLLFTRPTAVPAAATTTGAAAAAAEATGDVTGPGPATEQAGR